jgi:hypothetical protein
MMGGKNRRMSSGASAAEQSRIAEMYKTVIKLSSENVSGPSLFHTTPHAYTQTDS